MSNNKDIVKEAQMIIDSYVSRIPTRRHRNKKRKSSENTLWFFAGTATSAALFFAILLRIY